MRVILGLIPKSLLFLFVHTYQLGDCDLEAGQSFTPMTVRMDTTATMFKHSRHHNIFWGFFFLCLWPLLMINILFLNFLKIPRFKIQLKLWYLLIFPWCLACQYTHTAPWLLHRVFNIFWSNSSRLVEELNLVFIPYSVGWSIECMDITWPQSTVVSGTHS